LDTQTAVVLLGHGSRASGAGDVLAWVADRLGRRLGCRVEAASLQFNSPTLEECCSGLAAEGARRIIVAPYFLFRGNHLRLDIPEVLDRLSTGIPGVELLLAEPLGSDDRLVEVISTRIEAAAGLPAGAGEKTLDTSLPPIGGVKPFTHPIEVESFGIIDDLLRPEDPGDPAYCVVRRVVHATGEPAIAGEISFSAGALDAARNAFAVGAAPVPIITDVRMVAAGIEPTAARYGLRVICEMGTGSTAAAAAEAGLTRGAAGIRRAAHTIGLDGAVVVIGNAPTALFECLRQVREEGAAPALIIGVPVGFVGAAESKQALMKSGLQHITVPGTRGGSNIAAAITNALMRLAREPIDEVQAAAATQVEQGPGQKGAR
jgi:precorrin-8X/cobalt-precorrin-8 methylmutase